SEAIASGNLDVYIEPKGSTETQSLAISFNNLVTKVKDLLYKEEIKVKREELVGDILSSIKQNTDMNLVFNKAVTGLKEILEVERVFVYRFNPDWSGEVIAESTQKGIASCLHLQLTDSYFATSNIGEMYRQGKIFVIDDIYEAEISPCHRELYERLQIKSNIVTPVVTGTQLLGLICTQQCTETRLWTDSEIDFCTQLSNNIGLALDQINYLEQQQAETKRSQLLADIANSSRSTTDIAEIFQKAVQETQKLLNAERVSVYKFNADWSGEIVAEAAGVGIPPCLNMTVADSYFTDSDKGIELYRNGRVFVMNDVYKANLTPCHLQVYERLKIRSIIITPIVG
ncbi:MAG TPA: GAF domain-containing protein, partial [Allocoleopsis sp.]